MAVFGARACLELTPVTLQPIGLAKRTDTARAAGCLAARESRLAENELASAQPKNQAPNA